MLLILLVGKVGFTPTRSLIKRASLLRWDASTISPLTRILVGEVGIEPTPSGFSDQCSDLISYSPKCWHYRSTHVLRNPGWEETNAPWSRWRDSNSQPLVPKTSRLAIDLHLDLNDSFGDRTQVFSVEERRSTINLNYLCG